MKEQIDKGKFWFKEDTIIFKKRKRESQILSGFITFSGYICCALFTLIIFTTSEGPLFPDMILPIPIMIFLGILVTLPFMFISRLKPVEFYENGILTNNGIGSQTFYHYNRFYSVKRKKKFALDDYYYFNLKKSGGRSIGFSPEIAGFEEYLSKIKDRIKSEKGGVHSIKHQEKIKTKKPPIKEFENSISLSNCLKQSYQTLSIASLLILIPGIVTIIIFKSILIIIALIVSIIGIIIAGFIISNNYYKNSSNKHQVKIYEWGIQIETEVDMLRSFQIPIGNINKIASGKSIRKEAGINFFSVLWNYPYHMKGIFAPNGFDVNKLVKIELKNEITVIKDIFRTRKLKRLFIDVNDPNAFVKEVEDLQNK